jgi:hypothetical protein
MLRRISYRLMQQLTVNCARRHGIRLHHREIPRHGIRRQHEIPHYEVRRRGTFPHVLVPCEAYHGMHHGMCYHPQVRHVRHPY